MAFFKVDGRAEELTSWISLSYVCQGENLLIFIELLLIRVQFKTLLNQNKIKMKDKTWMEFMNQKVGFFYCILTTHLTVVLKGHLPLVVCLVVCYCFCNELVYIIKSRPSGESLLVFFKYYIIDKLEIPDIVLYFVPANVSFNKNFWFISYFDKVQNHLDTLDLSTSQKRTFAIPRGNTCILVL